MDLDKQIDMLVCTDNKKAYNALKEILYLIFDYLHKHYTFERFEV
ncbi:hypothetical protein [[Clostridium] innocuum]|nr:hypothetical protein [[Clostridium] innocuum]